MQRAARGFGILEATLALMMVLVTAVGILGITNQGVFLNHEGRNLTRATAVAQDFASQLQIWSYNDARLSAGSHTDGELTSTYLGTAGADLAASGGGYSRSWVVAPLVDTFNAAIEDGRSIVLTVSWDVAGRARSATFYLTKVNPAGHL